MTTTKPPFHHTALSEAFGTWSRLTGHDAQSAPWQKVWHALRHHGLVDDHDLRQRDEDLADPELIPDRTINALRVQVALLAGATYAASGHVRTPHAVIGVEIALAMLDKVVPAGFVQQPVSLAAQLLSTEMTRRIIGVYDSACHALHAEIRRATREPGVTTLNDVARSVPAEMPPLIDTILALAVHDDVFAEAVLKTRADNDLDNTAFAVLPRGHWLLYRTRPAPDPR